MSIQSNSASAQAVPLDTFETRLAIARFAAGGISAREAAMRVGVSGTAWRAWEAGTSPGARKPSMLSYIARQLAVDEDWLRDGGPLRTAEDPHPDGPDGGQEIECTRRDSNPKPSDPKFDAPIVELFPGRTTIVPERIAS